MLVDVYVCIFLSKARLQDQGKKINKSFWHLQGPSFRYSFHISKSKRTISIASSPGHSQILFHSRGENLEVALQLGTRLAVKYWIPSCTVGCL